MSPELNQLQETATTARAKAEELKAAITAESSAEEQQASQDAETAAVAAETAFTEAKAAADAQANAGGGKSEEDNRKIGDVCENANGVSGTLQQDSEGNFVCVVEPAADTETPDATESRTGFVENGRPGEQCTCPDGRTGTIHRFDEGLICIPNADQG